MDSGSVFKEQALEIEQKKRIMVSHVPSMIHTDVKVIGYGHSSPKERYILAVSYFKSTAVLANMHA